MWNYQNEVGSLFPGHAPINTLCLLIDSNLEKGLKTDDLKDQLLKWVYETGTNEQWLHASTFVSSWL